MNTRLRFCICGGGSLSHVLLGVFGANEDVEVSLLTRRPELWHSDIHVIYRDELELIGHIDRISNDPGDVIPDADVVILAVPSYARSDILQRIRPFVHESSWIGSFPGFCGFDWQARHTLGNKCKLFGSQRVPYVCQKIAYGETVALTGIRPQLFLSALPGRYTSEISAILGNALHIPTVPMGNYLCVNLSLSNPVFHPSRLYSLFKNWESGVFCDKPILFYEEWDHNATEIFGRCDEEIQYICRNIPLDLSYVKPIIQHYEVATLKDVTQKIRNIKALRGRYAPLIKTMNGYIPNFRTSFFSEDIPYGLVVIRSIAQIVGVSTPMIDDILYWAQRMLKTEYLVDGEVKGATRSTYQFLKISE